jgi:hypothetical protein
MKSIHRHYYTVWVEFTLASSLTILLNLESVSRNIDTGQSSALWTADTTLRMGKPRVFIFDMVVLAVSRASSAVVSAETGVPPTGIWEE